MCKFCELSCERVVDGERINQYHIIGEIKDGRQVFEMRLWRYIHGETHESDLLLQYGIETGDGIRDLEEQHIKIEYCPFCGEKL